MDRKTHRLTITRFLEYPAGQQVYIETKEKLRKKVNYTLNIRFNSRLGRDLEGFYLSSYVNKQGETKWVVTQADCRDLYSNCILVEGNIQDLRVIPIRYVALSYGETVAVALIVLTEIQLKEYTRNYFVEIV